MRFAVWAPNARAVSAVGDWNYWSEGADALVPVGSSGIWEGIAANAEEGHRYKLAVVGRRRRSRGSRPTRMRVCAEVPPANASIVYRSRFAWSDDAWLERRRGVDPRHATALDLRGAPGIVAAAASRGASSRVQLVPYVAELGFTHVELMPVMQHPYAPSWGYQVSGYFAPQSTFGSPDDFRVLVDEFHRNGVGVILDWVPAHFPRDEWALARFDGTALYEHDDPRRGAHPDWGTLIFNLSRHEVRNFLLANALYWVREFHADGLRVDAVASMLYLDYSRKAGEWLPNEQGGRENLEAVAFLRELNEVLHDREPGVAVIAEESTAWPGVSRPTSMGGLGFTFKWNMGWMHDTLVLRRARPGAPPLPPRRAHVLARVRVGRELRAAALARRGRARQALAALEAPGRPLAEARDPARALRDDVGASGQAAALHGRRAGGMGRVVGGRARSTGRCSRIPDHAGVRALVRDLNAAYRAEPALWEVDFRPEGFAWLVGDARDENVIAFARFSAAGDDRSSASSTSRRSCARAGGCRCRGAARWRRDAQHRLPLLRRVRRRQRSRASTRRACTAGQPLRS